MKSSKNKRNSIEYDNNEHHLNDMSNTIIIQQTDGFRRPTSNSSNNRVPLLVQSEANNNNSINNNNNNNNTTIDHRKKKRKLGHNPDAYSNRRSGLLKKIEVLSRCIEDVKAVVILHHKKKSEILTSSNIGIIDGDFIRTTNRLSDMLSKKTVNYQKVIDCNRTINVQIMMTLLKQEHYKSLDINNREQWLAFTLSDKLHEIPENKRKGRRRRSKVCEEFEVPNQTIDNFTNDDIKEVIRKIYLKRQRANQSVVIIEENKPWTTKGLQYYEEKYIPPIFDTQLSIDLAKEFLTGKGSGLVSPAISWNEFDMFAEKLKLLYGKLVIVVKDDMKMRNIEQLRQIKDSQNKPILLLQLPISGDYLEDINQECASFDMSHRFGGCLMICFFIQELVTSNIAVDDTFFDDYKCLRNIREINLTLL